MTDSVSQNGAVSDPSSGAGNNIQKEDLNNHDMSATKIVVKFQGKERVYDISDPSQHEKVKNLLEMGLSNSEIRQKAQAADNWNTLLERAKSDDSAAQILIGHIENWTGRKLTLNEKSEMTDLLQNDDPNMKKLFDEIESLKSKISTRDAMEEQAKNNAILEQYENQLSSMEKDKQKYPFFDRDEILQEASRRSSLDFKAIYADIYLDKIITKRIEDDRKERETLEKKRQNAFSESGYSISNIAKDESAKTSRSKNYETLIAEALKDSASKGRPILGE